MSYLTIAEFKAYAVKSDADAAVEALYQVYLDTAEKIVEDYLGYSPESQEYTHKFTGDGTSELQLKAKPVTEIDSISIDSVAQTVTDFETEDEMLINSDDVAFPDGAKVIVTYTAGYTTIPPAIRMTALQIASALAEGAGGNVAVTSKTMDGGNSRTFVNYTNYDRFLHLIYAYRLVAYG